LTNQIQSKFIKSIFFCLYSFKIKNDVIFREYLENLIYIEKVVKEIEQLLESYYNDNRTAYIFTSDHGMTDWGKNFEHRYVLELFNLIT